MQHEQASLELSAFLDGELASDAKTALEGHLAACADCRAHLEELRAAQALFKQHARASAPAWLGRKALAQARAEAAQEPAPVALPESDGNLFRIWKPALALSFVAAGVLFVGRAAVEKAMPGLFGSQIQGMVSGAGEGDRAVVAPVLYDEPPAPKGARAELKAEAVEGEQTKAFARAFGAKSAGRADSGGAGLGAAAAAPAPEVEAPPPPPMLSGRMPPMPDALQKAIENRESSYMAAAPRGPQLRAAEPPDLVLAQPASAPAFRYEAVRDRVGLQVLWKAEGYRTPLPEVDFAARMLVVLPGTADGMRWEVAKVEPQARVVKVTVRQRPVSDPAASALPVVQAVAGASPAYFSVEVPAGKTLVVLQTR